MLDSRIGVITFDEGGRIESCNRAAERIFACTAAELVGRNVVLLFPGAPAEELAPGVDREIPARRLDGVSMSVWIAVSELPRGPRRLRVALVRESNRGLAPGDGLLGDERSLARFLEASLDAIILLDAQGRIAFANAAAERLFGVAREDMQGCTHTDPRWKVTSLEGAPLPEERYPFARVMRSGEAVHDVELVVESPGGRRIVLSVNAAPLRDGSGGIVGVLASQRDVTERVRAEGERRQAEEAQRFLARTATLLASSLDWQATLRSVAELAVPWPADWCSVYLVGEEGKVRRAEVAYADPAKAQLAAELMGIARIGLDAVHPVLRALRTGEPVLLPDAVAELEQAGPAAEKHVAILRRAGVRSLIFSPMVARGRVLGAIGFATAESGRRYGPADLALASELAGRAALAIENARLYEAEQWARRAAERAADRTARLQAITAALSEALTPAQVAEVIVEHALAALGACAGSVALLSSDGEALRIVRAIGDSRERKEARASFPVTADLPLAEAVRTRGPIWLESLEALATHYPRPAAEWVTDNRAFASLPLTVEGRVIGAMGLSFSDPQAFSQEDRNFMLVLARECAQALERARRFDAERTARAEAQAAVRARDEFLSVAAHELKTPVTSMRGYAQLLLRQLDRPGGVDPQRLRQALDVINEQSGKLADLVTQLLDLSRIEAGKLALTRRMTDLVGLVEGVVQAARATSGRHTLVVRAPVERPWAVVDALRLEQVLTNLVDNAIKYSPDGGEIEIEVSVPGAASVAVSVRDHGIGIPPERRGRIFDRFYQAHADGHFGGMGLGLYISRQIVELHGGRIEAAFPPDGGTCFRVILPRAGGAAREPGEAARGGGAAAAGAVR